MLGPMSWTAVGQCGQKHRCASRESPPKCKKNGPIAQNREYGQYLRQGEECLIPLRLEMGLIVSASLFWASDLSQSLGLWRRSLAVLSLQSQGPHNSQGPYYKDTETWDQFSETARFLL